MCYVLLFVLLAVACVCDIRRRKIPNVVVILIMVFGIVYRGVTENIAGVTAYVLGAVLYIGLLYPLFKIGVLGAGDVKLLAVLEGFFSWERGLLFFLFTWIVAGIIALIKLLKQKDLAERMTYVFSYVKDVLVLGKWQYYFADRKEAFEKGRYVHMTIPMLIALGAYIGGVY